MHATIWSYWRLQNNCGTRPRQYACRYGTAACIDGRRMHANIWSYWRLQNNWGLENSFQRFLARVHKLFLARVHKRFLARVHKLFLARVHKRFLARVHKRFLARVYYWKTVRLKAGNRPSIILKTPVYMRLYNTIDI